MRRKPLNPELLEIALRSFRIDTLEVRGRNALDVHDVHVLAVHDALQAAYELGRCQVLADKQSGFPWEAGIAQRESSSVPTATKTKCGEDKGSCHSRTPHAAQRTMSISRPESARLRWRATSPPLCSKASRAANIIRRLVAPESFLQSLQWHAFKPSGRALRQ
jgi:hypothetical protein